MNLMDKMNCGVIYAVKLNPKGDHYQSIAAFMSKYTDTPIDHYNKSIITTRLVCALADLIENMEHPCGIWFEFWHYRQDPWSMDDFNAMCASLATVAVKDENGNYINGFRPIEEFEL